MIGPVIVMGVSGCGKSTLAQALAIQWAVPCIEGDTLHAPASVAKMAAGIALDDTDRWPWLERIGAALNGALRGNGGAIASCSALRRLYRNRLREAVGPALHFVMIALPPTELELRMQRRTGHFMPPALLASQLRTLERPDGEADVFCVDGTMALVEMVDTVGAWRASQPT